MRLAIFVEQDVSRLDVSVQDAVFMGVMHGARNLGDEFHRLPDRHRLLFDYFVKLAAFDKLHAEIALAAPLAYLVDGNDVWMIKARSGFGFQTKALEVGLCCPLTETNEF